MKNTNKKSNINITSEKENNNKIIYLEIIRIIACFMVIINHTGGYVLENSNHLSTIYYLISFSICKIGVPLFLLITGALIIHREYSYKKILKCIYRIIVPLIVLSFILYLKDVNFNRINIFKFVKNFIARPYKIYLWYIYALIGVYIVIPFLQKMVKNFTIRDQRIFIFLFLLIPTFINTLKSYFDINIYYNLSLSFFPIIVAFLVSGDYFSKIKITKRLCIISTCIFCIAYAIMFLSFYFPYINQNKIIYTLDSWNAFPVVIMSISIFIIIRYFFENKEMPYKFIKIIQFVGSTTFGIYLIHFLINYRLYKFSLVQYLFNFNSIIGVIVLEFVVFIISMLLVAILKKIPIIRKFL